MPASSTYNVIYLGTASDLDPVESSGFSENASTISGSTYGSAADPLYNRIQDMSPVNPSDPDGLYNTDNSVHSDQFTIDGNAPQTFDNVIQYNATLTYEDTTSATITAVVFQDTNGRLYLAPEITDNADQSALTAKKIESISLDSVDNPANVGMDIIRTDTAFVCFAKGTLIETESGMIPVEELRIGNMIKTLDHGYQALRWIGHRTVRGQGKLTPIRIVQNALGNSRDLWVSRQHRMLIKPRSTHNKTGIFVPAHKLVDGEAIIETPLPEVTYYHVLLTHHEIINAEGTWSESLYLGEQSWQSLPPEHKNEIKETFPELFSRQALGQKNKPNFGSLARTSISRKRDLLEWL